MLFKVCVLSLVCAAVSAVEVVKAKGEDDIDFDKQDTFHEEQYKAPVHKPFYKPPQHESGYKPQPPHHNGGGYKPQPHRGNGGGYPAPHHGGGRGHRFVAFSARLARQLYKHPHYNAIAFKKTDVNDGSFHAYSGIFTTPSPGLYYFAYHFLCHYDYPGFCRIALVRKDSYGKEHEVVHSWGTAGQVKVDYKLVSRSNNANNQYILWLNKGDKVYLKVTKGRIYDNLYGHGSHYSTFTGFSLGTAHVQEQQYKHGFGGRAHQTIQLSPGAEPDIAPEGSDDTQ